MSDVRSARSISGYRLLFQLAAGGMATVSVARQRGPAMDRLVVVKRVHRHLLENEGWREMLQAEARIAALIRHPNVVSLVDVVEAEGELMLVLEYVNGISLAILL